MPSDILDTYVDIYCIVFILPTFQSGKNSTRTSFCAVGNPILYFSNILTIELTVVLKCSLTKSAEALLTAFVAHGYGMRNCFSFHNPAHFQLHTRDFRGFRGQALERQILLVVLNYHL